MKAMKTPKSIADAKPGDELRHPGFPVPDDQVVAGPDLRVGELIQGQRAVHEVGLGQQLFDLIQAIQFLGPLPVNRAW